MSIDTIKELKKRLKKGIPVTVSDFMRILDNTAEKMINDEYDGMLTDDYIEDICTANEYYFTEDGQFYNLKGAWKMLKYTGLFVTLFIFKILLDIY